MADFESKNDVLGGTSLVQRVDDGTVTRIPTGIWFTQGNCPGAVDIVFGLHNIIHSLPRKLPQGEGLGTLLVCVESL